MDVNLAEQVLDELCPALEALDAQNSAVLQFLKEKAGATDEELAPYLEQAGKTSNVRWRAVRLRIKGIVSSAIKNAEQSSAKSDAQGPRTETTPEKQAEQAESAPAEKEAKSRDKEQEATTDNGTQNQSETGEEQKKPAPDSSEEKKAA